MGLDVFQWAVVLPLEITVAGTTVQYWGDAVPLGAWITIFFIVIIVSTPSCYMIAIADF